ncbi:MAG TPA: sigma-54-dependent transcriptional regulator [Candidatus Hypogeohydataceae bacterium YC41]
MENSQKASILLVDDERVVLESLGWLFSLNGYKVDTAQDGTQALQKIERRAFDLVVSDVRMPELSGLDLLGEVKRKNRNTRVIIITAYGHIQEAVSAIKQGAYDYLTKPLDDAILLSTVERALKEGSADKTQYRCVDFPLPKIVARDPAMREVMKLVDAIADKDITILLQGESGTGKNLIARYLHKKSHRKSKPFVHITCGTLPEPLLESELFGYLKGAFTGAVEDKLGLFELANEGTIFLDEISIASPTLQVKLLGVLESKTFNKLGGAIPINVDVRVIIATSIPLEDLVKARIFREDLYFRIKTLPIVLPPLRSRPGDIEPLCQYFIKKYSTFNNRAILGLTEELKKKVLNYSWPGNVRELENVIQRGIIFAEDEYIDIKDVSFLLEECNPNPKDQEATNMNSLQIQEKELLKSTLERFKGNKRQTATFLNLDRTTLYKKLKIYDLL